MESLAHGQFTRAHSDPLLSGPPGGVYPRFYNEAVQDELASAREGRPIFRDEERVEIIIPGNPNTMPVHRVNDEHRMRWRHEYEAFKAGNEMSRTGTPIEEWCSLGRSQVAELKALNIHTVEDVAGLADTAAQRIMGLFGLREKAKAWLDDAEQTKIVGSLQAENDGLRSEVASLRRQVEEGAELMQQIHREMMSMRNTPPALATMTAAQIDPMQSGHFGGGQSSIDNAAQSSLAHFDDNAPSGRRGRRAATADAA